MKIKIIDLLNNIYNCKDMPGKIVFYNRNWLYNDKYQDYFDEEYNSLIDFLMDDTTYETRKFLNTEVEIKEENKKIEKLNDKARYYFSTVANGMTKRDREALDEMFEKCYKTIDELIDEVNKLKNGGK